MNRLPRNGIALDLAAGSKPEALGRLADVACTLEPQIDRPTLLEALKAREAVVTTGIGRGMAIPHADIPTVPRPMLCLGIFPGGVDFEALDSEPVCAMFLLLGTGRDPQMHMGLLSEIARLCKQPELLPRLLAASSGDQVYEYLEEITARAGL